MIKKKVDIQFARVGGLSPVKQRGYDPQMPTMHCPPARKGIYAFVWPYIELFLLTGNSDGQARNACVSTDYVDDDGEQRYRCPRLTQMQRDGFRKFTHEGELWCHHVDEAKKLGVGLEYKGSWVKVTIRDFREVFKLNCHNEIKHLKTAYGEYHNGIIHDPYKHGLGGSCSRDYLEVFIERPKPGKVKKNGKSKI